jgi:hypothetical protein
MKTCTLCKTEKPLTEYPPRKSTKDGLHFWCRPCFTAKKSEDYQRNREKRLAQMAEYRAANPEKVSAAKKAAYAKKPEHYSAKHKERYAERPDFFRQKTKEWKAVNSERRAKTESEYRKRRYRQDPIYALETLCRARILMAFSAKRIRKESPTAKMIGCSYVELRAHLERQFSPGMSWGNRGTEWHIDHRIPLASASTAEEIEALCHFSNLQPLWAEDNYAKGAKMPPEMIA